MNITKRVEALANEIAADPEFKDFILIGILDGALPFFGLVQAALEARFVRFQYATINAKSYIGMISGDITVSDSKIPVAGKKVLFLDDVWDSGKTLDQVAKKSLEQGAKEIRNIVLVNKEQKREYKAYQTYVGFSVPHDAFIIGFGLDYEGMLRNNPYITAVDLKDLPTKEEQDLLDSKSLLIEAYKQTIQALKELDQLESVQSNHLNRFFRVDADFASFKQEVPMEAEDWEQGKSVFFQTF
jgi:hypoxanthine phosphoribosyltransferase